MGLKHGLFWGLIEGHTILNHVSSSGVKRGAVKEKIRNVLINEGCWWTLTTEKSHFYSHLNLTRSTFTIMLNLDQTDDLFSLSCWSLTKQSPGERQERRNLDRLSVSQWQHVHHSPTHWECVGGKLESLTQTNESDLVRESKHWEDIQTLSLTQPWNLCDTFPFNEDIQLNQTTHLHSPSVELQRDRHANVTS